jgi:NAD(P)-dependent dehydrogenase (short-subunit alcohol dehydrogenase family)
VCSNAGLGRNKRVLKETLDDVALKMFEVNFYAGIRLAQAYHALLVREGASGRILFTATPRNSIAGI